MKTNEELDGTHLLRRPTFPKSPPLSPGSSAGPHPEPDYRRSLARLLGLGLLLILSVSCGQQAPQQQHTQTVPVVTPPQNVERWPAYTPDPAWQSIVTASVNDYKTNGVSYSSNLQNYTTTGDFLNYGQTLAGAFHAGFNMTFDSDGVPLTIYAGQTYYNPVTVENWTLMEYGRATRGQDALPLFFKGVARLMLMQGTDGAIRVPYSYPEYLSGTFYQPGWPTGMAQGLALCIFARAYYLTGDFRYLDAGTRAFHFLLVPVDQGGPNDNLAALDPSLSAREWLEEYPPPVPGVKPNYTLNGNMFTMLGLYDWKNIPTLLSDFPLSYVSVAQDAGNHFTGGVDTLTHMLPYYDIGGFSAYDLGHITYGVPPHTSKTYHAVHIYLLHALISITGDPTLTKFEQQWQADVAN